MRVTLSNVRMAFPDLFKATQFQGEGKAKYGATFLFAPNHPAAKAMNAAFAEVAKEKWGAKAEANLKAMRATDKLCLRDGDLKSQLDGYEGNLFVRASSDARPTVVNRDKSPLAADDGVVYSGCYVNAILEVWAQDNGYGRRINATLAGVQFFADGDAFSGARPADADEFEDVSAGAEDDPTA